MSVSLQKLTVSLSVLFLLPVLIQAEPIRPGTSEDWKKFERNCVFGNQPPTWKEAAQAALALQAYLEKKNISCEIYPPEPRLDRQRLQDLRLMIQPSSRLLKDQKVHPLCEIAEERFWQATASAEICYSFSYVTGQSKVRYEKNGTYVGNDFLDRGFMQQILLPPDFFHRLFEAEDTQEFLETHEGFQYALAQHSVHELSRKSKKISPFFVSLLEENENSDFIENFELWRIPAIRSALKALQTQVKKAKNDEEQIHLKKKMGVFLKQAQDDRRKAVKELNKVEESLQNKQAELDFELSFDDLIWATVRYSDQKVAVFYLRHSTQKERDAEEILEGEPKLRALLVSRLKATMHALEEEKKRLSF